MNDQYLNIYYLKIHTIFLIIFSSKYKTLKIEFVWHNLIYNKNH